MGDPELKEYYSFTKDKYKLLSEKEKKLLLLISFLRFITFFGGIILIWLGFAYSITLGITLFILITSFFLVLLKQYSFHTDKEEHYENLEKINRDEVLALSGDYSSFNDGSDFINQSHGFSFDTDLFGKSSLFQYLNRTSTGYGREILANWLSDPYAQAERLGPRQETIREISGNLDWRQEFLAAGTNKSIDRDHISGLVRWLNEEDKSGNTGIRGFLIWFIPTVNLVSLGLVIAGKLHYSVFISLFLAGLVITILNLKRTNAIHRELTGRFRFLSSLGKLFYLFEKKQFKSDELTRIQSITRNSAVSSLKKVSRIIQAFDNRMNIIVGFALNGLLLWDLHCVHKLEKWKLKYRLSFPDWLHMLGQIDAYISLGNYAFNNRSFTYPVISGEGIIFKAKKLGHQLIEEEKRICNDFTLPAKGNICIISGANMAGKSTFLRTVAVNYILAMAGAPVCAEEMSFTPVKLFTSMRTTDSLSSNESYFYAELRRLKLLQAALSAGENMFFILDEILKGTNSEDKSMGSKLFLNKLIVLKGTGLIATHDTSLGTLQDEFPDVIFNKCIEIEIDGEVIIFDYLLRDGITSRRNAVLLMKQMGILD